jgi:hypothetical protein
VTGVTLFTAHLSFLRGWRCATDAPCAQSIANHFLPEKGGCREWLR